jgi:hypothetical protein
MEWSYGVKVWSRRVGWNFGVIPRPSFNHILEYNKWLKKKYGDAEIIDILEKVHVKFCKLLLNLKTSTPIYIYGEIGRYPQNIHM